MVEEEIRNGDRIADLLHAEIEGFEQPPFDEMAVLETAADTKDSGVSDPAEAVRGVPRYSVTYRDDPLFEVVAQPDRIYLEFAAMQAQVADAAAEDARLRVRPKATHPPATLVFVERAADVKRVIDVLRACLPPQ